MIQLITSCKSKMDESCNEDSQKTSFAIDSAGYRINRTFYNDGKLEIEDVSLNGNDLKFRKWYRNGRIEKEINYDGLCPAEQAGIEREYYTSGQIKMEAFIFGVSFISSLDSVTHDSIKLKVLDGYWIHYYENGKISTEYSMIGGLKEGFYREYYKNGQFRKIQYYVKGIANGIFREYTPAGKIIKEQIFSN